MTLKFTVASGEVEDFALELVIDADATFHDLHCLILQACHFQELDKHRFYICDEDWHPEQRIFLHDEGLTSSDEDLYLMSETPLSDFLEDEGQRLAYRFDPENKRMFLMELTATSFGERVGHPHISRKVGQPPLQIWEEEPIVTPAPHTVAAPTELDETFYGDEGYEREELDEEGFDIMD